MVIIYKIAKAMIGLITLFFVINLTACSYKSEKLSSSNDENDKLRTELIQEEHIEPEKVSVNGLLNEFKDWDGNKEPGQVIYTLNLNKDAYILTIMPNRADKNKINWVEMIFIKPLDKSYNITQDELVPLHKLVSVFKLQDISWESSIVNGNIPYEKIYNDWQLKIDYYMYQDKKEGISLTLSNLEKSDDFILPVEDELSKKRQEFADKISRALGPVCYRAYFNSRGEFIIEVNSEWNTIDKESKKDLIYSIKNQLRKVKKELDVEGYGQFFSRTGRPLESFYAN